MSTSPCCSRAFSSDSPTLARLGSVNTAVGTFSWSTGVGSLRNSVRASHMASAVATGVRLIRLVTSPMAWIEPTELLEYSSTATAPSAASSTPTASSPSLAVFANPNVATVGLSEGAARERFDDVDVYKTSFRALKLTMTDKVERTFMKLVVHRSTQRVLGAHMIGPDAGEIIQGVAIAVKLGATKPQFDATIGIHPTVAEEFVTMREKVSV